MNIRLVNERDFDKWLKMRYDLWSYHTMEDLEEEMKEIFKNIQSKPVYFAEENDNIMGFIEVSIHKEAPGCVTTKIGFIEGWYVKPKYRKLGVGKKLVKKAEQWAKSMGCKEMASDTTKRYPISPAAHMALGYKEVDKPLHFMKAL